LPGPPIRELALDYLFFLPFDLSFFRLILKTPASCPKWLLIFFLLRPESPGSLDAFFPHPPPHLITGYHDLFDEFLSSKIWLLFFSRAPESDLEFRQLSFLVYRLPAVLHSFSRSFVADLCSHRADSFQCVLVFSTPFKSRNLPLPHPPPQLVVPFLSCISASRFFFCYCWYRIWLYSFSFFVVPPPLPRFSAPMQGLFSRSFVDTSPPSTLPRLLLDTTIPISSEFSFLPS